VLVNSTHGSAAPTQLLTAHHCVPTQARASSLESYWLLYAPTCGGTLPAGAPVIGGADLIDTDTSTDTAVVHLRRPVPRGVRSVERADHVPPIGTPVIGIHHLSSEPLHLAVGSARAFMPCTPIGDCTDEDDPNAIQHLRVRWSRGGTVGGSSGSGLFTTAGHLLGVLSGGPSCNAQPCPVDDTGCVVDTK
jgi:hypothetical protein